MPDLKSELEAKVVPAMAPPLAPHRYEGLSIRGYLLVFLLEHPGAVIKAIQEGVPPGMHPQTPTTYLSKLIKAGVLRREMVATPHTSGRSVVGAHYVNDLYRVDVDVRAEVLKWFERRGERLPTIQTKVVPPTPTVLPPPTPSMEPVMAKPTPTPKPAPDAGQPLTPGIQVYVSTNTRRYAMSVAEARMVYEQLKDLFG